MFTYTHHSIERLSRIGLSVVILACVWSVTRPVVADPFGSRGPDIFRHYGNDVPYDFRDISATGTSIALSDDQSAYISLGFNFSYFGNDFSTVNVCSNGFLSFSSSVAPYIAQPLPGAAVPDMIAGGWTDLDPALGGEIYVETLGVAPNREFVVMFDDVRHRLDYSDLDATPSTFEMILHETSNDIEFQYERLWQNKYVPGYTSNQMSIGFQNADANDGLQLAFVPFDLQGGSDMVFAFEQGYLFSTKIVPPLATDLGTLTQGWMKIAPQSLNPYQTHWYRFNLPEAANETGKRLLLINTVGSDLPVATGASSEDDTMIGLYDDSGNFVQSSDDAYLPEGAYLSQLAFGDADGPLAVGDYFLAASAFPSGLSAGGQNFDWNSTSDAVGTVAVNFFYGTDVGTLDTGTSTTEAQDLSAGEVQWYRFGLDEDILAADGESLVINTFSFDTTVLDTEIGLYGANGNLIATSDDAVGLLSQLEFGIGALSEFENLLAGTYYLAAAGYNTAFSSMDFNAVSQSSYTGNMVLNFTATIVPSILLGDYNDDGIVDAADYTVWRNNLGANIALPNEDPDQTQGSVTIEDYAVWKSHYGETTPSGGSILRQVFDVDRSIPEPTTDVLLLAGGLTLSCFLGRVAFGTACQ